ncbi:hypothetical protein L208DRAFT_910293 [Tricholoma matsutake]|nr:hypothetical protein L208DRAFT_910293 [Tricholoma matsutake 945]
MPPTTSLRSCILLVYQIELAILVTFWRSITDQMVRNFLWRHLHWISKPLILSWT